MTPGRNDPCPCGSGKKYKKCCLAAVQESGDASYRRASFIYNALVEKILDFAERELGDAALEAAVDEFFLWDMQADDGDPFEEGFQQVFIPWMLFSWRLEEADLEDMEEDLALPPDTTIAELFVQRKGRKLDPRERQILTAVGRLAFTFCEVLDVRPGAGFSCQDLLTGGTHQVIEYSATHSLQPGDILFCAIAQVEGVAMLLGSAPVRFPHSRKLQVIELREELRPGGDFITVEEVLASDADVRERFLDMYKALLAPPVLTNSDGERLSLRTLHYAIDDPAAAFEALHHLCPLETREALLADATLDAPGKAGQVRAVSFPWVRINHAGQGVGDNTILGHIAITGNKMTVEVNSERRAAVVKDLILQALGPRARHKTTTVRPLDALDSPPNGDASRAEHAALMQDPAIQEHLAATFLRHWESWVDSPLPALGGATPRQAVTTPQGREKVEALLHSAELRERQEAMHQGPGLARARNLLGLS